MFTYASEIDIRAVANLNFEKEQSANFLRRKTLIGPFKTTIVPK